MVSRRSFLTRLALVPCAPFINRGRFQLFAASSPVEYSAQTIELVQGSTVIDMLSPLTLDFKKLYGWQDRPAEFHDSNYETLRNSGIAIFHPSVGFTSGDIHAASLADITRWNLFIAAHSTRFMRIDAPADIAAAKASGRIGIVIGQKNSAHFRSVRDVDSFYKMGQRVSQLTYVPNRIGGGSSDPRDPGLTPFGGEIVSRMNQLGMAVDVSHCADRTTLDAVDASQKPVLITHSNCRALAPHVARCKTDEAIRKAASKGGVMGVTMIRLFCHPGGRATLDDVLDHIDHIVEIAGIEHAGIGSDVDLEGHDSRSPEQNTFVDGIRYPKKIFDVTEGLLRRGYAARDIEMILGGNFARVLGTIWADRTEGAN